MQTEPGEGMCPHDRRSPRCSAGASEEPELSSVIPRISQRVKMAGMNQRLQVEMRGAKIRPIDEKLRMTIHPPEEAKRQGMRGNEDPPDDGTGIGCFWDGRP